MPRWLSPQLCERLSQGDIFRPGWDADDEDEEAGIIVLSHNCEIDKSTGVVVASYILQQDTDRGLWGDLVRNRVARGWIVPDTSAPGWVNFRTVRALPIEALTARLGNRLHSMTPDGRDVLIIKFFQFLRRHLPDDSYDQTNEDRIDR